MLGSGMEEFDSWGAECERWLWRACGVPCLWEMCSCFQTSLKCAAAVTRYTSSLNLGRSQLRYCKQ